MQVLLASGTLPLLLSLPMLVAKLYLGLLLRTDDEGVLSRICVGDIPTALSYTFYFALAATGFTLLVTGNEGRRGLTVPLPPFTAHTHIHTYVHA